MRSAISQRGRGGHHRLGERAVQRQDMRDTLADRVWRGEAESSIADVRAADAWWSELVSVNVGRAAAGRPGGAANRLGEARPRGVGKGSTATCAWTAKRRAKAESTERCRWLFSGDETTDVGSDRATPVSDNYAGRRTVRSPAG
jgi:hypothetical protein